jgi:hypothetical protein
MRRRHLDEARAVWLLVLVDALAIWITYARLPATELYNVTGTGFAAGASRVLVDLNFPMALIAIGIALTLFERLDRSRRRVCVLAVALCAVVVLPGVVRQGDLDARWINAVPAVGVVLVLALTLLAGPAPRRPFRPADWARIGIAAVLVAVALPWIAAEAGFFLDGVPVLHRIFLTGAVRPEQPGLPPFLPAVHHGHHHGLDGLMLALASLLLSRRLPLEGPRAARVVAPVWLGLMLAYGVANMLNDAWLEQVVKRGWTTWLVPNMLEPKLSIGWALIVVAGLAIAATAYRPRAG